jgi:hypothetical protein
MRLPKWTKDSYRNATLEELSELKEEAQRGWSYSTKLKVSVASLIWEGRLEEIRKELLRRTAISNSSQQ